MSLIKLPIYWQRAFHRLNPSFIPNRTREICFFFITSRDATQKTMRVDGMDAKIKKKTFTGRKTS